MTTAAEIFPPGEFLREELDARGWSQTEFAEILGRPVRLINELIAGKKSITPDTAHQIGRALGTGPELWMNLESQYQLSKARPADDLIARRANLYERFPVRDMIKRGWITSTRDVAQLEDEFARFYGVTSLDGEIAFKHAAKKTDGPEGLQLAWLTRARQVASELVIAPYREAALHAAMPRLAALLTAPEETRHVDAILSECGVRFVVVEPIPGSKIDGACFWLGDQPVVALSLRLDRIDNFWFVLRHELEHVLRHHGQDGVVLDVDLDGATTEQVPEEERQANEAAANFCVPRAQLLDFVHRVQPFFKEERVLLFAQRLQIHPGLVVGQLQRHLRRYDLFRKHQVKVRHLVTASARTDGWGVVHTA
jgi:HTH-type transcriptional regulator/antitoxin HigA